MGHPVLCLGWAPDPGLSSHLAHSRAGQHLPRREPLIQPGPIRAPPWDQSQCWGGQLPGKGTSQMGRWLRAARGCLSTTQKTPARVRKDQAKQRGRENTACPWRGRGPQAPWRLAEPERRELLLRRAFGNTDTDSLRPADGKQKCHRSGSQPKPPIPK